MNREIKNPVLWGLGGAVLASTCCVAPLVFALLGVGTAAFLVAWLALRPLFLLSAALFLIAGTVMLLRRTTCSLAWSRGRVWLAPLLMAACFLGSYGLLNSVVAPWLYQPLQAHAQRSVMSGGVVMGMAGQIIPLRRVTFHVYMNCSGCAATLQAKLLGLPGVHAAAIDYRHGVGQMLYDPTRTTARTLIASIPNQWFYEPRMRSMDLLSPAALSAATQVQAPLIALGGAALILLVGLISGMLTLSGTLTVRRYGVQRT